MQLLGIGHGLARRAHVGLGDDFQKRRAGTVQVDAALADEVFVQRFARVFFEVGTHQAHALALVAQVELDHTALHHRDFELADLVALGQVRVEVVLARKHAAFGNVRTNRQAELDGALNRAAVHHRQRAGQGQIDRAGLGIGLGAKGRRRAAEDLGLRGQLGVGLEADHDFKAVHQRTGRNSVAHVQIPSGRRRWKSVACCRRCAALSSRASEK